MAANKKGMVQDVVFYGIIVFIFAVMIVAGAMLNTRLTERYQASSASSEAKDIQQKVSSRFAGIWDNSFLFFFIIFGLSIVLVLYYVSSSPALFFVGIILLAFAAVPIGIMGNAFDSFQSSDEVAAEAATMPIMGYLMSHILEITLAIGILGIILLFSRVGGGY